MKKHDLFIRYWKNETFIRSYFKYNDKATALAEQDQTSSKCNLILPYTLHKIYPYSRKVRIRIKLYSNIKSTGTVL